jgi:hypothetical protein
MLRIRHSTVAVPRPTSAFTLVELAIMIAVTGAVLLGLVFAFHEKARLLEADRNARFASLLADDLMNEIRSRNFSEPNSTTNIQESLPRRNFDDVDDYAGWVHSPPQTIEGTDMTNFAGFTHRVIVTNVWPGNLESGVASTTAFKRITVIVSNKSVCVSNCSVMSKYD